MNITIQQPYFNYILSEEKKIEGRLNKGKFLEIKVGDILEINEIAKFEIVRKNIYKTFREMIIAERLENVVPNKKTVDEAVQVYYKFCTKEDEEKYGVVAIEIKKVIT